MCQKVAVLLLAIGFVGCGPRGDVAVNKIYERIDGVLGKMEVQRAEIETGIKAARKGVEGVRSARIKAEVAFDQIDEKVRPFQDRMTQCEQTAAKLKELLAADKSAEIGGKKYTVEQLKDMAVKVIQARKEAEAKVNSFKTARENMGKVVTNLKSREQAIQTSITNLQAKLVILDAELSAAKAMKSAAAAAGDSDATLLANLDSLDGKIASLSGEVRVQLNEESAVTKVGTAEKEVDDLNAVLQASQKPGDLIAELDAISKK